MKKPQLIHKKRLKRKIIRKRRLAHARNINFMLTLPKQARIKFLKRRIEEARLAKQEKRAKKQEKINKLKNLFT